MCWHGAAAVAVAVAASAGAVCGGRVSMFTAAKMLPLSARFTPTTCLPGGIQDSNGMTGSRVCKLRRHITRALDSWVGAALLSMILTGTPKCAKLLAAVRPTGPAPTTSTVMGGVDQQKIRAMVESTGRCDNDGMTKVRPISIYM